MTSQQPWPALAGVTPAVFTVVMGTGILAVAAVTLPDQFPGLRGVAVLAWLAAAALLIAVTAATALHWRRFPGQARGHARDAELVHFYGAPPMAIMVVGDGALLAGRDLIGLRAAVDLDWVLWLAGATLGLAAAAAVPYLMFSRAELRRGAAGGGWLMSVVPPMVAAASGALLVPFAAAGQIRLTVLLACYAMLGASLLASLILITLIWGRLAAGGTGPALSVPALWIVLGPLGQSVTAANLLGTAAGSALPAPAAAWLRTAGLAFGVPVWGFALLWAAVIGAITLRTAADGLPFSLAWWSFTFPVGTCVTGTSQLALATGAEVFRWIAAAGFAGLVLAWLIVASRTTGALRQRRPFRAAAR